MEDYTTARCRGCVISKDGRGRGEDGSTTALGTESAKVRFDLHRETN